MPGHPLLWTPAEFEVVKRKSVRALHSVNKYWGGFIVVRQKFLLYHTGIRVLVCHFPCQECADVRIDEELHLPMEQDDFAVCCKRCSSRLGRVEGLWTDQWSLEIPVHWTT